MYLPQEIIKLKRNGGKLPEAAIQQFVTGLTDNSFSEGQTAALAMAIYLNGMATEETVALTRAMRDSGAVLNWQGKLNGPVVDKHSTGGVGDKVTLILAPLVASFGVPVAKMSGRGLGHTGGTIDKLESIPGFDVNLTEEEFLNQVEKVGFANISQSNKLLSQKVTTATGAKWTFTVLLCLLIINLILAIIFVPKNTKQIVKNS